MNTPVGKWTKDMSEHFIDIQTQLMFNLINHEMQTQKSHHYSSPLVLAEIDSPSVGEL